MATGLSEHRFGVSFIGGVCLFNEVVRCPGVGLEPFLSVFAATYVYVCVFLVLDLCMDDLVVVPGMICDTRSFEGVSGLNLHLCGKPVERLVKLSFTRYRASTCFLSTWWSTTALKRDLVLRGVSRLDAFSGYPVRT